MNCMPAWSISRHWANWRTIWPSSASLRIRTRKAKASAASMLTMPATRIRMAPDAVGRGARRGRRAGSVIQPPLQARAAQAGAADPEVHLDHRALHRVDQPHEALGDRAGEDAVAP